MAQKKHTHFNALLPKWYKARNISYIRRHGNSIGGGQQLPGRCGAGRQSAPSPYHPSSACSRPWCSLAVCCASPSSSPPTSSCWCRDGPPWTLHRWGRCSLAAERSEEEAAQKDAEILIHRRQTASKFTTAATTIKFHYCSSKIKFVKMICICYYCPYHICFVDIGVLMWVWKHAPRVERAEAQKNVKSSWIKH